MKKNKIYKILMILGIIVCLSIISICIYFVYNELNKTNDNLNVTIKNTKIDREEQKLEVTDEEKRLVEKLITKIHRLLGENIIMTYQPNDDPTNLDFIYQNKSVKSTDFSNNTILSFAFLDVIDKTLSENPAEADVEIGSEEYCKGIDVSISSSEIKKYISNILGTEVNYKNETINIILSALVKIYKLQYNSDTDSYNISISKCRSACSSGCFSDRVIYKIDNFKKYNNKIEVIVKTIFLTYDDCIIDNMNSTCEYIYDNQDDLNLIMKNESNKIIDTNKLLETTDVYTLYKYTFKYDKENKNYYFDSIGRVDD